MVQTARFDSLRRRVTRRPNKGFAANQKRIGAPRREVGGQRERVEIERHRTHHHLLPQEEVTTDLIVVGEHKMSGKI
jgi:hypothetical protein